MMSNENPGRARIFVVFGKDMWLNDRYRVRCKYFGGEVTFYEKMQSEVYRLQVQIDDINAQLKRYPKGKLIYSRTGKYVKWYVSDGHKKTYIPKKRIDYIQKMAMKKYLTLLKDDLMKDKQLIESYLIAQNSAPRNAEQFLAEQSVFREILSPLFKPKSKELQDWMNEPYECNTKNQEHLVHKTSLGFCVRSKSEALIATFLHINQIPFRYECKVTLGKTWIYPDFLIRHPKTGEVYYWEHFGLMNDMKYCRQSASKLQLYSENGIIPTIHLITTYETKEKPLTTEMIQKIIDFYFLEEG